MWSELGNLITGTLKRSRDFVLWSENLRFGKRVLCISPVGQQGWDDHCHSNGPQSCVITPGTLQNWIQMCWSWHFIISWETTEMNDLKAWHVLLGCLFQSSARELFLSSPLFWECWNTFSFGLVSSRLWKHDAHKNKTIFLSSPKIVENREVELWTRKVRNVLGQTLYIWEPWPLRVMSTIKCPRAMSSLPHPSSQETSSCGHWKTP